MTFFSTYAQDNLRSFESVIIQNVTIIDQTLKKEDAIVSLLIKQKKLELVTQDEIESNKAEIIFDANKGFVLGRLEIGSPADFIILNKDPRTDVGVILDTKNYVVFAMSKGEIVLNKLLRTDVALGKQNRSWSSYSTPPISLPLSYQNKRKWNVIRTKPFSMALGGALLIENTRWLAQDNLNRDQIGELDEFEGGSVRGIRLGIGGTINFKNPWTYFIAAGSRAFERGLEQSNLSEIFLFDYRIDIPVGKATISVGKTKETISLSRLSQMIYLPSQQERASIADGLLPARNIGIVVNNTLFNNRMTWATGVFNNWFEVDSSFSDNPTVFTGRITGLPYLSENENHLLHLGISTRFSNASGGIQYKAKTEIFNGPIAVDTDLLQDINSTFHYGLEIAWRNGPFTLLGEYIQSTVDSSVHNTLNFNGYNVTASYVLTGEVRPYNKRSGIFEKVYTARDVNTGGWGKFEIYSQWSSLDLNDKSINGGEMNTLSLGVHWSPVSNIYFSMNYRYSTLDRFQQTGSNHGVVTRLAFVLE